VRVVVRPALHRRPGAHHAARAGRLPLLAVLPCLLLDPGCASHSARHAARPTPPGAWRTALALDGLVFEHGRSYAVYPAPELAIRRGMGPRWDLGGKLGGGSLEASATFALIDRADLAVALAPGLRLELALLTNNGTDLLRGVVFNHLLVERRLSRGVALVGTATAALALATSATLFAGVTDTTRLLLEPAVGVGVRVAVGSHTLWPEVTATFPYGPGGGLEAPVGQVGIAFEF
jgi:hypothetical protein